MMMILMTNTRGTSDDILYVSRSPTWVPSRHVSELAAISASHIDDDRLADKNGRRCSVKRETWVMGCLHDPANVQQTSSKCIQNTRANAGRLLDRVNTLSNVAITPWLHGSACSLKSDFDGVSGTQRLFVPIEFDCFLNRHWTQWRSGFVLDIDYQSVSHSLHQVTKTERGKKVDP